MEGEVKRCTGMIMLQKDLLTVEQRGSLDEYGEKLECMVLS